MKLVLVAVLLFSVSCVCTSVLVPDVESDTLAGECMENLAPLACEKITECAPVEHNMCLSYFYYKMCRKVVKKGPTWDQCIADMKEYKCGEPYPPESCHTALVGDMEAGSSLGERSR